MKNFIAKNRTYIILCMLLIGLASLGFGLDWAQTQVHWKEKFVAPLIIIGLVLFFGGIGWLIGLTSTGKK